MLKPILKERAEDQNINLNVFYLKCVVHFLKNENFGHAIFIKIKNNVALLASGKNSN